MLNYSNTQLMSQSGGGGIGGAALCAPPSPWCAAAPQHQSERQNPLRIYCKMEHESPFQLSGICQSMPRSYIAVSALHGNRILDPAVNTLRILWFSSMWGTVRYYLLYAIILLFTFYAFPCYYGQGCGS